MKKNIIQLNNIIWIMIKENHLAEPSQLGFFHDIVVKY